MYLVHTCLGEAHWPRCRARTQPVVEAAGEKGGSGEGWSGEEGLLLSLAGSKELKPADWKILKSQFGVLQSPTPSQSFCVVNVQIYGLIDSEMFCKIQ